MHIERLTTGDYDDIIGLWRAVGLPHKPRGRDRRQAVEEQMKDDPDLFIGAFEDGRLVGTAIGSFDGRKGWINRVAVHPDCRRRGYAKKLVAACEEALRMRGARIICTLIETYNSESLAFFEQIGYVVGSDIIYLSKRESDDT